MKKIIYGIIICFLLFFINCNKESKHNSNENIIKKDNFETLNNNLNKEMYVNTTAGLRVRNIPNIESERIGLLENFTKVNIIKEENEIVYINGIEGKWVYINSPIEGWIFNGYLINTLNNNVESNIQYKNNNLPNINDLIDEYTNIVFGNTYEVEARIRYFIKTFYPEHEEVLIERRGHETSVYYIYSLKYRKYTDFFHMDISGFPQFNNSRNTVISVNDAQRHSSLIKIYSISNGVYTEILNNNAFINCVERMFWINDNEFKIECDYGNDLLIKRNGLTFDIIVIPKTN